MAIQNFSTQEVKAILRSVRISPIKLNLLASMIRGKKTSQALKELTFVKRRIAKDVKKTLLSAVSNAENNYGMDIDQLFVYEAYVGKGSIMKRWRARARGRIGRIQKPFSHLTIKVREQQT